MTKDQKIDFIHDLVNAVRKRIIDRVNEMPEEWDGHELRRYIADKFDESAMTVGWSGPHGRPYRARTRNYRNEVLVRNL